MSRGSATNSIVTRGGGRKRALRRLGRDCYYEERERVEARFDGLKEGQYGHLTPSEMEAAVRDTAPRDEVGDEGDPIAKEDLLAHFSTDAAPVVVLMLQVLPPGSVRQPDMSVHCLDASRRLVPVSFIHYVSCTHDRDAPPDDAMRLYHKPMCT